MSREYDLYLEQHKENVAKAFNWIRYNLPEVPFYIPGVDYEAQICFRHDASKTEPDEYEAYDIWFYGGNRSYQAKEDFNRAWLTHIHRNPHHWQHWVLINDEPKEGEVILDMPHNFIVEMICDWWAFSHGKGQLDEIFHWYDEHKDYMKLSNKTRKTVDDILAKIKAKLEELDK